MQTSMYLKKLNVVVSYLSSPNLSKSGRNHRISGLISYRSVMASAELIANLGNNIGTKKPC